MMIIKIYAFALFLVCPATHCLETTNEASNGFRGANCNDGEDCNTKQCKKAESRKSCDDIALEPATNPEGKTINITMLEESSPFCVKFNKDKNTEGFEPCPGIYDNIAVVTSPSQTNDDIINPLSGDMYLHLSDRSGGSLACGTGTEYTGDWTSYVNTKCHELCFDVKLFYDGCHKNVPKCTLNTTNGGYYIDIYPAIIIQGGAPDYFRGVFRAYKSMTDADGSSPEWRRICAPLSPLNSTGGLPSNEDGYWAMATPNNILSGASPIPGGASSNADWPALLSDITAIQLPIDFTGNPAERAGYDNICMRERDCTDLCDPEPLCYWQHEWRCEDAKKEEWYSNFTRLASPLTTFPKRFCICKALKDCCPDLCSMAEQEFTALLLNVASGQVSLDCGVKECEDCFHNTRSIISIVDNLLATSSRSDYDCSKALHFLTGINHDITLCDSPNTIDPEPRCPQSDECELNKGNCVTKGDCIPSATVGCEDHFCMKNERCTCEMKIPCNQSIECKKAGGRCKKNCQDDTSAGVSCDDDKCRGDASGDNADQCSCEIRKNSDCPQSDKCVSNKGNCVSKKDCIPSTTIACEDDMCETDDCTCKRKLPCIQTKPCEKKGGRCIKNCQDSKDIECQDICFREENGENSNRCFCAVKKCKQTINCKDQGGECVNKQDCSSLIDGFKCDDRYCIASEGCTCKIPKTVSNCSDIQKRCQESGGNCVNECFPVEGSVKCLTNRCSSKLTLGTQDQKGCYCKVVPKM